MVALLSSPLVLLLIGVILFLLVASKKRGKPLLESVAMQAQPMVLRSHRDCEIDEEAQLVADHYRNTARQEYIQAALDRHRAQLVDSDARRINDSFCHRVTGRWRWKSEVLSDSVSTCRFLSPCSTG